MQYTFSKSHRAKLSDFKTVFTFPVHAVDTKLELLINLVRVAPGPLVTFYPNLLLQRRTKLMVWNYIFNGGIYVWQVISNSEFCKNCKYLFSHFRQSLLPPPATCISLDHSQSRYIYVIFSSVIEHVISTGYLLTWSITPNIQPLFWRAWTRIIASARSRYLYVTYSYVIRHHLQNVIASVMVNTSDKTF